MSSDTPRTDAEYSLSEHESSKEHYTSEGRAKHSKRGWDFARQLERELAELRGQLEGANLRADDAHLSCIAAEEERELLRGRHAAGVIEGMRMAEDCVEAERCKIGAIDGYDYTSGQEYGLCLATIVIRAEISRLTAGGTTEPK